MIESFLETFVSDTSNDDDGCSRLRRTGKLIESIDPILVHYPTEPGWVFDFLGSLGRTMGRG